MECVRYFISPVRAAHDVSGWPISIADIYLPAKTDETISIADFFPPNRGFDFY